MLGTDCVSSRSSLALVFAIRLVGVTSLRADRISIGMLLRTQLSFGGPVWPAVTRHE